MTSAAAVSAALRRAGFNPLGSGAPRSREGLRVKRSLNDVYVAADLDNERQARELATSAAEALAERGFTVSQVSDGPVASFYVTSTEEN